MEATTDLIFSTLKLVPALLTGLLVPLLAGLLFCIFSLMLLFFDASEPADLSPPPSSLLARLRRGWGPNGLQIGHYLCMVSGVMLAGLVAWWRPVLQY
ncbi:Hypp5522 [Branchiostoma lanceolatum]|uniref:Hypp5522 protein n=1 Tax=Branchiostoma lanceolatum TaxID=7740 RepID=A0A8J9YQC2_BRALA|nr:Hypp5522 [Branchiostoma lanceolatum]